MVTLGLGSRHDRKGPVWCDRGGWPPCLCLIVLRPRVQLTGVSCRHKHQNQREYMALSMDLSFLSRCYNATDCTQLDSRRTMVTYQMAIRKLAKRVCLL